MDHQTPKNTRPLWQQMALSAGRTALTLAIIAGAGGAGFAGYSALSTRAATAEAPAAAPLTTVAPVPFRLEASVSLPRVFTGQFEAPQEVALSFEEGGTIAEVLVRDGDRVAAGVAIARLDTRLLEAERSRLEASRNAVAAQQELAQRTNTRQLALLAEGHATQARVDETSLQLAQLEASVAEIDAALAALDVRIAKAVIVAPFSGHIGTRLLDTGAVAGPGAGVVTLLEEGAARFRVAIDPDLATEITTGELVEISVSGHQLAATLTELAPELDPATRARTALFELTDAQVSPPSRSTGDLTLYQTDATSGAWVPLSALRQGPRGTWTLLTVTDGDPQRATIGVEAVEVIHLDAARAFVRGAISEGTLYLPGGTHRVVPGEVVRLAEAG